MRFPTTLFLAVLCLTVAGCTSESQAGSTSVPPAISATTIPVAPDAPTTTETSRATGSLAATPSDDCGHDLDPGIVNTGFNEVVDSDGAVKQPQGRPLQEGDRLRATDEPVTDPNSIAYALIASYMMPIRDALACDLDRTTENEWLTLTEILTLNGIKTDQDLSGPPPEQVYSTLGIFEHLSGGEDFNAMMKYLEEAELELKCLAFEDFDFTNPEGVNHCEIHGLAEGSGLILP